jgi:hypothetical protein
MRTPREVRPLGVFFCLDLRTCEIVEAVGE